ncbi:MAG: 50S ribosomal protein L21 [candidate division KSB1 bacterium]|nr:50S ribosomal protein L21 [candidate division KSB1 bacterium]MDZ7295075.1 50S ribosomal protein L21 [candidate division KSB1 bacterium]MDZ7384502.1 50S ribosomal protein L21 [candidate division KSB1 bacterium]MDZ7392799.1 50S ribosomal protein L21 [candidate division KSB1 bacterium]MDZ7412703.1 50S ribosomal protein L21 [candidate division KSB1 bacterium]
MYAIVDIAGKQFRVEQGAEVIAPRVDAEVGATVDLGQVYLLAREGEVRVGTPTIEGATIQATVVAHGKGPKVIVFKKKRRKGYKVKKGHRQPFTRLRIEKIVAA